MAPRRVRSALPLALLVAPIALLWALPRAAAQDAELQSDAEPSAEAPDPGQIVSAPEADEPTFEATAVVQQRVERSGTVEAREVRDLPGLQGDPYRIVETLPGVIPVIAGLPFVYVRGAPPAGQLYLYDDIPLPLLFHLGAGPAVIHPALIGELRMWAGAAPGRYGRNLGATIAGDAARPSEALSGEVEARIFDVNGFAHVPITPRVRVTVAGRYGWPGLLVRHFFPGTTLDWADWLVRVELDDEHGGRATLITLGAYDSTSSESAATEIPGGRANLTLAFSRVEARYQRPLSPDAELGVALRFGWDQSRIGTIFFVESTHLAPRLWLSLRAGDVRMRFGADFSSGRGHIRATGSLERSLGLLVPDDPRFLGTRTRTASSVYAEASIPFAPLLRLDLGLRGDLWITSGIVDVAPSIRASAVLTPDPAIEVRASGALAYQPISLVTPLPGLADAAVGEGLSRAIRGDLGVAMHLPGSLHAELVGFVQRLDDVQLPDLYLQDPFDCRAATCVILPIDTDASALAYGLEVFLRRDLSEDLAGWISYTLAQAEAYSAQGFTFAPLFDVRHVLNAVLRWRIVPGLEVSARAFARSGRMGGTFYRDPDTLAVWRYEQRLSWYFRLDAEVSYAWDAGWGHLRVSLGWFNTTLSAEPAALDCPDDLERPGARCAEGSASPIFYPTLSFRASL